MDTPSDSSGPQGQPRPPPPEPNSPAPATDPQWRTACRTCGASFKSRNQLMRHLYRSHPGKPGKQGKPKAPSQTAPRNAPTTPAPIPSTPTTPTAHKPGQPPQVHPFSLLGQQQQLAFAAQVLSAIFTVGMQQQREEEGEGQAHDEEKGQGPNQLPASLQKRDHLQASLLLSPSSRNLAETPVDPGLTMQTPPSPTTNDSTAAAPDQTWTHEGKTQAKATDDPELEDSDDDDDGGGVALFDPAVLEELPFRLRPGDDAEKEREAEEEGLDAAGNLD